MVPEWPADFKRFRGDLYRITLITGSAREKRHALESGADVFVTNFETAVTLEPELRALLRSTKGRSVLAIDESFFIKSLDAKRTRALRRLREWCGRAFVLCGTPAPNAPQDLVQQFSLVDFGHAFEQVSIPKDRQRALPIVQDIIENRGLYVRHLKVDVLPDLPEKKFQRLYVRLEPVQQRAYESALRDLILDLESMSEEEFQRRIPNFLARRAALLQICSNPVALVPGYREIPAKLLALDTLLSELITEQREKVVLWSFYTASIDAIIGRYGHHGTVRYDGAVADVEERRAAVRRFQQDDETMLFVANPAAAGAGLTLHRAKFAIYESFSNQAAHYLQSLDRIHRRGQAREVEYIMLLGDDTIELSEYDRLIQKERAAQELLGDPSTTPPTRETFLAETRGAAARLERGKGQGTD
jgi:SNF2 family DNA or RNA helicase